MDYMKHVRTTLSKGSGKMLLVLKPQSSRKLSRRVSEHLKIFIVFKLLKKYANTNTHFLFKDNPRTYRIEYGSDPGFCVLSASSPKANHFVY